jgi:glucokinase
MILAGDIGGTNARLALFERRDRGRIGPPRALEELLAHEFPTFLDLLASYRKRHPEPVEIASLGVAGPAVDGKVWGTNLAWDIDSRPVSRLLGAPAHLINDLEATGYGIPALTDADLETLQEGVPHPSGNAGIVAAGTGLGESLLARVGEDLIPVASEAGHADFAPRTDDEVELFQLLRERFGRVSWERVLSGPGLALIAEWLHARDGAAGPGAAAWGRHVDGAGEHGLPALVSHAGLGGTCPWCARALEQFVSIYGAEAGNVALRGVTRGGLYVAGGIAPRILPALRQPGFLAAFLDKEPHTKLLAEIPVRVIRNELAGMLGAARYATLVAAGDGSPL